MVVLDEAPRQLGSAILEVLLLLGPDTKATSASGLRLLDLRSWALLLEKGKGGGGEGRGLQ